MLVSHLWAQGSPLAQFRGDGSCAYEIYVSEIMLQQTQLSRVLESYYFPFLTRFPTLSALANSSEQEVLHLWQGLGYYSRARNLRSCAKLCVKQHNSTLPDSLRALRAFTGHWGLYCWGDYVLWLWGRVAHFADSNIARVLQRLTAKPLKQKWILALAKSLLRSSKPHL